MSTTEQPLFALYQHKSEGTLRHGDSGRSHLVQMQLLQSNFQTGIHKKTDAKIVGLAHYVNAIFESEYLVPDATAESRGAIADAQSCLDIPAEHITRALANNMVVVYTHSQTES